MLLDLAIHHIDLAMHLLDAVPEQAAARLDSRRSEDDTAELSMTFPTGVRMESFFSFCDAEQDWMEIQGSAGRLRVDRYRLWRARLGGRGAAALGDVATIARTELAGHHFLDRFLG